MLFFLLMRIVDVQQFVNLALDDVVIDAGHERILLGAADAQLAIGLVQALAALLLILNGGKGLTAAADAAARAGHDLDEIKMLAVLHALDDLLGIAQAAGHGDVQHGLAIGNLQLADALAAALSGLLDHIKRRAGLGGGHAAQHGLGHAAGHAEDHACAGNGRKGHIHRFRPGNTAMTV